MNSTTKHVMHPDELRGVKSAFVEHRFGQRPEDVTYKAARVLDIRRAAATLQVEGEERQRTVPFGKIYKTDPRVAAAPEAFAPKLGDVLQVRERATAAIEEGRVVKRAPPAPRQAPKPATIPPPAAPVAAPAPMPELSISDWLRQGQVFKQKLIAEANDLENAILEKVAAFEESIRADKDKVAKIRGQIAQLEEVTRIG